MRHTAQQIPRQRAPARPQALTPCRLINPHYTKHYGYVHLYSWQCGFPSKTPCQEKHVKPCARRAAPRRALVKKRLDSLPSLCLYTRRTYPPAGRAAVNGNTCKRSKILQHSRSKDFHQRPQAIPLRAFLFPPSRAQKTPGAHARPGPSPLSKEICSSIRIQRLTIRGLLKYPRRPAERAAKTV